MPTVHQHFDGRFDLVVIGGGMHGACAAALAARNGWKVALVEKGDFGSGVSANSLKVIHGGLRYLQHLDVRRMRESIAARSLLLRLAPDLVKPRGFAMPLKSFGLRSRPSMAAALALNEWISRHRNDGLDASHCIPPARLMDADEVDNQFAGLALPSHRGGALWYDAVAEDTERLTLAFILDAERSGAVAANYTRATGLLKRDGQVAGVSVVGASESETTAIEARHVLWAAGASWSRLLNLEPSSSQTWVRAINLVLDLPWSSEFGLALSSISAGRGRRNFFFVPWRARVMVGTWYTAVDAATDTEPLHTQEIQSLLADLQPCFPAVTLQPEHVTMVHRGLLPSAGLSSTEPSRNVTWLNGAAAGLPDGFSALQGVKYTTAPMVAAWTLSRLGKALNLPMRRPTWNQPLLDATAAPSRWTEADVRHAVEKEHARHLADVVLRRFALGSAGAPAPGELNRLASSMGAVLGWNAERIAAEAGAVVDHYARLGLRPQQ